MSEPRLASDAVKDRIQAIITQALVADGSFATVEAPSVTRALSDDTHVIRVTDARGDTYITTIKLESRSQASLTGRAA